MLFWGDDIVDGDGKHPDVDAGSSSEYETDSDEDSEDDSDSSGEVIVVKEAKVKVKTFSCDFKCGYKGLYADVEAHEKNCPNFNQFKLALWVRLGQ